jgi:hypothetical protein
MQKNSFIDKNPSLETYWRAIILLGKNTASYKFAWAKTLLDTKLNNSLVKIEDISLNYALNICEHLKKNNKQHTGLTNTFLEDCRKYNRNEITDEQLNVSSIKNGFNYVIDAFHNVVGDKVPLFYENIKKDKAIKITDNFYRLLESNDKNNFFLEINSRWRLWETAISLDINPKLIEISFDVNNEVLFTINNRCKRIDVTSSRDALNGYQKGKCFYCYNDIKIARNYENSCDVDHFFPDKLKNFKIYNVDQVWNLVLSCKTCNRGSGGKFEKIAELNYLYLLNKRNNWYIESHHPLRETIIKQTGKSAEVRKDFLQNFYNNAVSIIPAKWKPQDINGEIF